MLRKRRAAITDEPVPLVAVSRNGTSCSGLQAAYGPEELRMPISGKSLGSGASVIRSSGTRRAGERGFGCRVDQAADGRGGQVEVGGGEELLAVVQRTAPFGLAAQTLTIREKPQVIYGVIE
ncbi:hypothetical protein ACGFIV_04400 [Sphaerisporangium sp. NPDC049003]|uniref:hypothetical protein n=1 Tax=Sphaerisporangium sp. NPDC049003 TaxID=3364517 RepID=UPI003711A158